MNPQDNPARNSFASLNNPSSNGPNLSNNQNQPLNAPNMPPNLPKGPNISGGIIQSSLKTKKSVRGRVNNNFSENPIDRYFSDLLKKFRQSQNSLGVKSEILGSNQLHKWLREGLDEFIPNQQKDQLYETQYKNKPFLRLTTEEIGFGRANLSQYSQKVDLIFGKVIETMTKQLNSNPWQIVKLLRKHLRQGNFYPSLYQAQYGKELFKPNAKLIDEFFISPDSNIINEAKNEYSQLLAKCIELYFQEYHACILCLQSFLHNQLEQKNSFGNESMFIHKTLERSFGIILWKNYCALSVNLLNSIQLPVTTNIPNFQRQKCRQVIQQKKVKVFLYLVLLFQKAANQYQRMERDLAQQIKEFSELAITRIDKDICKIQGSDRITSFYVSLLIRQLTQLFLAIFPWKTVQAQKDSSSFARIKRVILNTLSNPFKPIRIVIETQPEMAEEAFIKINQQLQNGEWAIHSHDWKRWLGLFLNKFTHKIDRLSKYPMVLKHIIWLCKSIMKEQFDQFWQEEANQKKRQRSHSNSMPQVAGQQNRSYLIQLLLFLQKILKHKNSNFKSITLSQCFSILTASLGSRGKNHINDTLRFIKQSNFEAISLYIKQQITTSLSLEQRISDRKMRIMYNQAQKQKNIEQELKFICKIVEIGTQRQLCMLEQYLFEENPSNNGFPVIIFLIKIFQRLSPDAIHDLKCLRYIIKALDAIFIDIDTRKLLPLALGATQAGKWSCGKIIRQIVDVCSLTIGSPQMLRQAKKLRYIFGLHVNNILKISNSIHEYFPSGSRREDEKLYQRLQNLLKNKDYYRISHQFIQRQDPPLKYVPWLHNFLLILQSNYLTSIDLENVHLLLLKMRIQRCTTKQFTNMQLIVEMLNNSGIEGNLGKILTPTIVSKPLSTKHLFGLSNSKLQSYISLTDSLDNAFKVQSTNQTKLEQYIANVHSKKLASKNQGQLASSNKLVAKAKHCSKQYRLYKQNNKKSKEKTEIYSQISNSLRVIQTLLRLSFEGQFQLVKKLNLYKWVKTSFFEKGHFFLVPFTVQLQSLSNESGEQAQPKTKATKLVQHQLTTSINIIHTIASLLDFQYRFQIDESQHPTQRMKLKGNCYFQISILEENESLCAKTVARAQLSLLGDQQAKNNISVSVLQIMQHLILLNYDKIAFYCLTNRIYPQNKSMSNTSTAPKILQEFYLAIMKILARNQTSVRTREICLSFLCSCIKSAKFSQFIRSKAFNFKQPLTISLNFLLKQGGMTMISKLLLFFNLILSDRPQADDLLFVKSCLNDFTGLGNSLATYTQTKIREIKASPKNNNLYNNLLWSRRAHQLISCKMALLLYLALLSIFINTQSQYLIPTMVEWLLRQSEICTQRMASLSLEELDIIQANTVKLIEQSLRKNYQKGYLEFTKHLQEWLLFEGQGSLGEDFVYRRWQTYHKALEKQDPRALDFAVVALRTNNQFSLQMAQQALSQLYYTVLLGLFQKGKHGYYFVKGQSPYSQIMAFSISPKGERSPNCIQGTEVILGSQENTRKVFSLIKSIIAQIWKQNQSNNSQLCKNNAILLLCQIFKTINKCYELDPIAWKTFNADSIRVISKIEYNFWSTNSRLAHETVNVYLLQSLIQLSYHIYISDIITGSPQSIKNYLTLVSINYEHVLQKMQIQSILKLGILVQQLQISSLLSIQSNNKIFRQYINCPEHSHLITHIKSCLKVALNTIQDKSSSDGIRSLAIIAFNKALQISNLIKQHNPQSIYREFSHRLATRLEIIAADQGEEQMLTQLFLLSFVAQATASSPNEWMRMAVRIFRGSGSKLLTRAGTFGSIQTLWNLVQNNLILQTLVNISSVQFWSNKQAGSVMTEVFVIMQQNIHKFLMARVTPANPIEHQIASRIIFRGDNNPERNNYYGSIYAALVELRMHENIRYFMLFLLASLNNCPLLAEFCQKTIVLGPLEQHTWERIKITLEHILEFISKFLQSLIQFSKEIVDISISVNSQGSFASIPIRAFFESPSSQNDLIESALQTVVIFTECVYNFVKVWKSYDWKSRIDWKMSRTAFLTKCSNMVSKWREISKKINGEHIIKEKTEKINYLLSQCQEIE